MARPRRAGAHEALLDAAREEFSRRGVIRARVEDVARRAGVSKGAFYLHFRSKEEAFRDVVQRFLGALEDHAHRRARREDGAGAARRTAGAAAIPARVAEESVLDGELLDLLWRSRHLVAALAGAANGRHRELHAAFRVRLRALLARRVADRPGAPRLRRDVPPEVVVDVLAGSYEGLARRMVDLEERPDLAAWARAVLLVLYGGALEGGGAAPPARRTRRRADPRSLRGAGRVQDRSGDALGDGERRTRS